MSESKCEYTGCPNYVDCHSEHPDITKGCEPISDWIFNPPADAEECKHCNGYGSSLKEDADKCTKCNGVGLVRKGTQ